MPTPGGGGSYSLEKFKLYETQSWFYLVARDSEKRHWRILKIDRTEPAELNIVEDPVVYTKHECAGSLQRVAEGNKATGGLHLVTKAYGIVGFIKFRESHYMLLVSKRRQIGSLCGHAVYAIDENQLLTVPHPTVQTEVAASKTELRYRKLLSSVDLTKDFYFSYTYNLMHTLQRNALEAGEGADSNIPYDNMFVWNAFLTLGIRRRLGNTRWTVALVHGHFEQAKLSIYGHVFSLTLIARRSRHFAGTRYLKRGVNDKGRVANDVETEQIVIDETKPGLMSSVVQNRGSIPLFWSQEASRLSPKPDIVLQRYDPVYLATKLHFEDLSRRYGDPIIILNLIKTVEKRPREMMLRREFATAVGYLNQILPEERRLKFIHWDFHKFAKSKSANVLAVLGAVATEALDLTGFYYSGRPWKEKKKFQRPSLYTGGSETASSSDTVNYDRGRTLQSGVLRTNCIDCLDRTNVAQYAYGLAALGRQLHSVGITNVPRVDPDSTIAAALMDMYQNMGDALALQYGGSAAHNTVFPERHGRWKATTQSQEFLKSIKRYYSNTYTDGEKQDAMNLFLGYFQPQEGKPALWDLDSDYYLHVAGCGEELFEDFVLKPSPKVEASSSKTTISKLSTSNDESTRLKLTSFDKIMQVTSGLLKVVCTQSDSDPKGTCTAPDAAEVQLKSPNWLFGQRKHEEPPAVVASEPLQKEKQSEVSTEDDWVGLVMPSEQDVSDSLSLTTESEKWYGSDLLFGTVENSPAYLHYAQFCEQVGSVNPFDRGTDETDYFCDNNQDDGDVASAMEAALAEFDELCALDS
ncbi:phosphoinositide phosphatase SAC1 [Selaginella moellendorffii]|uniref:phosphoinositide phosphatase SAC1 n=1 Tax=Selaginella moellendorffii TaxID=88036 RepID=UPI000D1CFF50|nr:phosphoinositide phosphatase SAC1 [Selaginella moellendorffii]|eukprot:XP_024519618.1 phosphoinositide phosphatase SAC1 [Selaginella moellendorffii]